MSSPASKHSLLSATQKCIAKAHGFESFFKQPIWPRLPQQAMFLPFRALANFPTRKAGRRGGAPSARWGVKQAISVVIPYNQLQKDDK